MTPTIVTGSVGGTARIGSVYGTASIVSVYDTASIDRVYGTARIGSVYGTARIGSVYDTARIGSAGGTATIHLYGGSLTRAGSHVAVFLHSASATFSGGTLIDLTNLDLTDAATWADHHAVKVGGATTIVYKAVDSDLMAGQEYTITPYPIGGTVVATDWRADSKCGHGLHFGATPAVAAKYYGGTGEPRFLACQVELATMIPLEDKLKSESCIVLYEVDRYGDRVTVQA